MTTLFQALDALLQMIFSYKNGTIDGHTKKEAYMHPKIREAASALSQAIHRYGSDYDLKKTLLALNNGNGPYPRIAIYLRDRINGEKVKVWIDKALLTEESIAFRANILQSDYGPVIGERVFYYHLWWLDGGFSPK